MNEWFQVLTLLIANFGVVWWFRKESRDDWKRCNSTIETIRCEMKEFREDIRLEMKDFHEKLFHLEKDFHEKFLKIERVRIIEMKDLHERLIKIEMERK